MIMIAGGIKKVIVGAWMSILTQKENASERSDAYEMNLLILIGYFLRKE